MRMKRFAPFAVFPCAVSALISTAFFTSILSAQSVSEPASQTVTDSVELPPVLLQMLRNQSVFDELDLSSEQRQQVRERLTPIDNQWWSCRNLPDVQRIATVKQLTAEVKEVLRGQLNEKSFQRLEELEKQALGTRMFLLPEVATAIGLSPATVQQIHKLASETNAKAAELSKRQQAGEAMQTIVREQQALTANERKNVVQLLSMSQKSRIQALTGKPFAFETLRRQLPEPPELDARMLNGCKAHRPH